MSIAATKKFLVPDWGAEKTVWGRIDQGRRELAVQLRKDVTVEKLAELIGRRGPSLAQWKSGSSRPTRKSLESLEKLFFSAGLHRYSAQYLDYGAKEGIVLPPAAGTKPLPELETRKSQKRGA